MYFHLQKDPHHGLSDLFHQHLTRHVHHFHFRNIVAAAEVVVVAAIIPGVAAAVDRNITMRAISNNFLYLIHRHMTVVDIRNLSLACLSISLI